MQTSLFRLLLSIYVLCSFSYGYSFTSQVDKTSFMVGEKAVWTLKFCYDNVEEYTLEEPKLQDFKVTLLLDEEQKENNLTTCALQEYELRAQKAGTHTLPVLKAHNTEEKINISTASEKTRRAPNRSAAQPLNGINTVKATR